MLYLILAGLIGLVAVLLFFLMLGAPKEPSRDETGRGAFATGFGLALTALVLVTVFFSMTIVSARTVGIITSFGKEQGTKPAGMGWAAPWESKEEFPTNVQYLELNNAEDAAGTVQVNYKGGGKGDVDATIRWRMDETKALDLWRKYREFDRVTDQLVKSAARDSIGVVIGAYAPNDARAGENRRTITEAVVDDLVETLSDDGIKVDSVSITAVRLDENTQKSIEAIIKANADIERAKAEQERAKIDANTAKIRESSGSLSAGALQRYCLEVTNGWDAGKNGQLPATWGCLGGSSPPVVVGR